MFSDGIGSDAFRFEKEKKILFRGSSRGIVLPSQSKFRSGHLPPSAIPVSTTLRPDVEDRSGEEDTTDSGEDVYGERYSLDSSPQDERVPNRPPRHDSDYTFSDVSSSRGTFNGRHIHMERTARENRHYPIWGNEYMDDDESESASSSEFSSTQAGSVNNAMPRSRATVSGVASMRGVESATKMKLDLKSKLADHLPDAEPKDVDIPTAPPFCGIHEDINQVNEKISGSVRTGATKEAVVSSNPNSARAPTFHASALGPWHGVIAYDACVRLCLHAWAKGNKEEAPMFLTDECKMLRDSFGLQQVLLQSEEELMSQQSSEPTSEGVAPKPKKVIGRMKVQVRKVKTTIDPPTGCSISALGPPKIKMEAIHYRLSTFQSMLTSTWKALRRIHVASIPTNSSFSHKSLAYMQASTQYIKQVSGLLKTGVISLRNSSSSYESMQETYSCLLRLKSSSEDDGIKLQPGSGESHLFFPDSLGDELIIEVQDSKGKYFGRVLVQVASIVEDVANKLHWSSIYQEPEHDLVGKLQMFVQYSTSADDNSHSKCGSVAETVAYDLVLEVAMKVQHFKQRNLLLYGEWKWLLSEFASYYGVSDVYTKLRYLSYIMDVATPTADCLTLVHDLLMPVLMKSHNKTALSHQENRILGETKDQIEHMLSIVFENYKSLDESLFCGVMDVFKPAIGIAALALEPSVQLYILIHDILSPEAQTRLCHYFQHAARKRSKRHLAETDEYVTNCNNNEATVMDTVELCSAYQKITALCVNIKNEIWTDIEIHNQHILPSFIDLPNLSSCIYSTELCNRLRAFLIACPPSCPSPHVAELVVATADFQRDLSSWKISHVKGGVDAKELFHLYIILWIKDKRKLLLDSCKLDKVKWSGVRTQHSTTPFVDEMYDRLRETLADYEVIISRWPEYIFLLENAIADVEKAIVEALDKQYADVLLPLKEILAPKRFGLKYVQKLTKRSVCTYAVPEELGILLNSMKRMLEILRPKIEARFKTWGSCIPDGGSTLPGEHLSEVTVMLRTKFRNYMQAVVDKLAENSKLQSGTKLKKILQDSKENVVESDVRSRIQQLKDQITITIDHLHTIFETHVFVAVCRGYWEKLGQDVLSFLDTRKENRSWYKGSRITISILDDTFASQMQQLLGNAVKEKDLEPPRSIMEIRSILCKDAPNDKNNSYYY